MISNRNYLIREIRRMLEEAELTDGQRVQLIKLLAPLVPFIPRPDRTKKGRAAAQTAPSRPRWLEK